MAFFGGGTTATAATTEVKDVELVDPPNDSISCLDFSPTADYLAVGSWNNEASKTLFVAADSHTSPDNVMLHTDLFVYPHKLTRFGYMRLGRKVRAKARRCTRMRVQF